MRQDLEFPARNVCLPQAVEVPASLVEEHAGCGCRAVLLKCVRKLLLVADKRVPMPSTTITVVKWILLAE